MSYLYRALAASASPQFERLLWTSDPSPSGARTALVALFRATAETALPMAEDARTKGALCRQMVQIADYVLDGYRDQGRVQQSRLPTRKYK